MLGLCEKQLGTYGGGEGGDGELVLTVVACDDLFKLTNQRISNATITAITIIASFLPMPAITRELDTVSKQINQALSLT